MYKDDDGGGGVTFHQSYGEEKARAPQKRTPCQADAPSWDNFFRAPNEAWIEQAIAVRLEAELNNNAKLDLNIS